VGFEPNALNFVEKVSFGLTGMDLLELSLVLTDWN
jgi:hypothetical protein